MDKLTSAIKSINQEVQSAMKKYHRAENAVRLLAVSKTQSAETILAAFQAGLTAFGENYLQEALAKIAILSPYPIEWHFLGNLQGKKCKRIAKHFAWVHSVDSIVHAELLSHYRAPNTVPLNICLQINIDAEKTKSGFSPDDIIANALAVQKLPRIKLRGLMVLPKPREDFHEQREIFHRVQTILQQLNQLNLGLDTLSMGMSNDFIAAIAEGATIIRIGSAIFGERK
jgi:pyridoxal phosphate enzyme (YggS family)